MNRDKFLVTVKYTWFCEKRKCTHQYSERHCMNAGQVIPLPLVPHGWNLVSGRLYCDRHQIKVTVDGKLTTDCTPFEK